jgi:hypothetical protein
MPPTEPTHGEILERIGELKGNVAALTALMAQKREDISAAFALIRALEQHSATREEVNAIDNRIRSIEAAMSRWAGVLLAATFLSPIVVPIARQSLQALEQPHQQQTQGPRR